MLNHFNILKHTSSSHLNKHTLTRTWTISRATTCIETGLFLVRPPALDPCHRQRQLIADVIIKCQHDSTSLRQQRSRQTPLQQHDLCWSACAGKPSVNQLNNISSLAHMQPVGMSLRQQRSCRVSLTATTRTPCQSAEASLLSSSSAARR